jgi:hypothetical protein
MEPGHTRTPAGGRAKNIKSADFQAICNEPLPCPGFLGERSDPPEIATAFGLAMTCVVNWLAMPAR